MMAQSAQIAKINWWHERLADLMIAHPEATLGQIAARLNKSLAWVSVVKNSDTFIDYWQRRSSQHSEAVTQDVKAKGFAAAELALDHLLTSLESPQGQLMPPETLLSIVDTTMKRFGYDNGAKAPVFNFNLGSVTPEQLAEARAKLRRNEDALELTALPAPEKKSDSPGDSQ